MNYSKTFLWISLNLLRFCNIISLSIALIIGLVIDYEAWATMFITHGIIHFTNRLILSCFAFFLIIQETEFMKHRLLDPKFPLFDYSHSWALQGCTQLILGSFLLGYRVGKQELTADAVRRLGPWSDAAGWLTIVFACFYVFLGSVLGPDIKQARRLFPSKSLPI